MDLRLAMLATGMFAMGTDNFVVAGILPSVAHSLGTSVSLAGQMVTIYALSFAIFAPVMAAIAGDWPRKALLVSALGAFVLGNAITALSSDIGTVLASRALAGFGAALFSPTALGVAASLAPAGRRGQALATVTVGLAGATALGAPLGTFIGGLGDWRMTLWFVAAIGLSAMIGVGFFLRAVPAPSRVSLRERFAPLSDVRVLLTLLTTLFAFGGFLMVYTYAGLVLEQVTGGDPRTLAVLLLFWGVAAVCGNLLSGRMVDRFESHRTIVATISVAIVNFILLPWSAAHSSTAIMALMIWGSCGWGLIVPQQHRLVKLQPEVAPLLLALNNTATYGGLAGSAFLGGLVIVVIDGHYLSWVGSGSLLVALVFAELAHWRIESSSATCRRNTSRCTAL